jgi:hypothetical protein
MPYLNYLGLTPLLDPSSYHLFFYFYFFVVFFFTFIFLEKILFFIIYPWNIYHSTCDLFISFFLFIHYSFVICFFYFFLYCFFKNYYTKTKKIIFQCINCNIVPFLDYIKNEFKILHVFINTHDPHCILLYISINFFNLQLYFLLIVKKIY